MSRKETTINRRQILKTAAVGIAAGGGIIEWPQVQATEQANGSKVPAIKVSLGTCTAWLYYKPLRSRSDLQL